MAPQIDILGIGCIAVDELYYVADYPPADSKAQVLRTERHCGGLTATALVAASRLGARCAYAGMLGDDELSRFVRQRFREEGIDLQWVRPSPEFQPIHSLIIVDQRHRTRTILYDLSGFQHPGMDWPLEQVIRAARVLFVDHGAGESAIRAARIARAAPIPVVADLENDRHPRFQELLGLIDHVIVSGNFASELTGCTDAATATVRLWEPHRQAVVVTCGADGCWYVGADDPRRAIHQPAFSVEVVDTTGCGDVFHGAYAAALVEHLDLPARVRLASAAAALKATRTGGQVGIPTRAAVHRLLEERIP